MRTKMPLANQKIATIKLRKDLFEFLSFLVEDAIHDLTIDEETGEPFALEQQIETARVPLQKARAIQEILKVESAKVLETTKVIFRKYNASDGEVIALFPEIPATLNYPYEIESYMHIGQHGAAHYSIVVSQTKPAKSADYADLLEELKNIGYQNIQIFQKETPSMRKAFELEYKTLSAF